MDIDELWTDREDRLKHSNSRLLAKLNPPLSDGSIATLENQIGIQLPNDFKRSLSRHNGGEFGNELVDNEELLSSERILEEWRVWHSLLDEIKDYRSEPDAGVRDCWWSKSWIPISSNGSGDGWFLDLDPAPGGTRGQVIRVVHDMAQRTVGAKSYTDFFSRYFLSDIEK